MSKKSFLLCASLLLVFAPLSFKTGAAEGPVELITAEEAATPDAPLFQLRSGREDDKGPTIEVISPTTENTYESPLAISVKFLPKEGIEIDLSTFKVEYLKFFTIDITERLKPYVTVEGIDVPDAKLPSGKHSIRLAIGDVTGAVSRRVFTVKVH